MTTMAVALDRSLFLVYYSSIGSIYCRFISIGNFFSNKGAYWILCTLAEVTLKRQIDPRSWTRKRMSAVLYLRRLW